MRKYKNKINSFCTFYKSSLKGCSLKIDGVIASVMALDRAIRNGHINEESVYDNRGLLLYDIIFI